MANRIESEYTHGSALRAEQPEQMLDQGGLAGAVRDDGLCHAYLPSRARRAS
jgi:hypothetical protein